MARVDHDDLTLRPRIRGLEHRREIERKLDLAAAGKQCDRGHLRVQTGLSEEFFASKRRVDGIHERMSHVLDGDTRLAIDKLLKVKNTEHLVDARFELPKAPARAASDNAAPQAAAPGAPADDKAPQVAAPAGQGSDSKATDTKTPEAK